MANVFKNLVQMGAQAGRQAGGGGQVPIRGLIGSVLLGSLAYGGYHSLFTVNGGQRAVIFNRITGVRDTVFAEGTHFRFPWFEYPTVFDITSKPQQIRSPTGTKDLQTVDITLRVLFKPREERLPQIFSELGTNYADRILPSIVNETLKSVVAQFNANQLITMREQVSQLIRRNLTERADQFNIIIDDVSLTHLSFGPEYTKAIEAKQVAQQQVERAKYVVKQALEDKKSTVLKAQGEARAAELIGEAVMRDPGYLELRQLDAAKEIATTVARSNNRVYLDADSLLLNILKGTPGTQKLEDESRLRLPARPST